MPALIDLTGKRFMRLTVLGRAKIESLKPQWNCICDCGKKCIARASDLRSGHHRSCGCLHIDTVTKHGHAKAPAQKKSRVTKTYSTWMAMKSRCLISTRKYYPIYGGRGITICERWMDFKLFLEDMGVRPTGKTLDRIDNNGNYEVSNCRWATPKEQADNKTATIMATFEGKTQSLTKWALEFGIDTRTLRRRIADGWIFKYAITRPYIQKSEYDRDSKGRYKRMH